ncbi:MAG: hypothetical protein HY921_06830 [Elusimicrobia bacterium]|nr:hypothetical protein [Elusimicrobiota bacterium]
MNKIDLDRFFDILAPQDSGGAVELTKEPRLENPVLMPKPSLPPSKLVLAELRAMEAQSLLRPGQIITGGIVEQIAQNLNVETKMVEATFDELVKQNGLVRLSEDRKLLYISLPRLREEQGWRPLREYEAALWKALALLNEKPSMENRAQAAVLLHKGWIFLHTWGQTNQDPNFNNWAKETQLFTQVALLELLREILVQNGENHLLDRIKNVQYGPEGIKPEALEDSKFRAQLLPVVRKIEFHVPEALEMLEDFLGVPPAPRQPSTIIADELKILDAIGKLHPGQEIDADMRKLLGLALKRTGMEASERSVLEALRQPALSDKAAPVSGDVFIYTIIGENRYAKSPISSLREATRLSAEGLADFHEGSWNALAAAACKLAQAIDLYKKGLGIIADMTGKLHPQYLDLCRIRDVYLLSLNSLLSLYEKSLILARQKGPRTMAEESSRALERLRKDNPGGLYFALDRQPQGLEEPLEILLLALLDKLDSNGLLSETDSTTETMVRLRRTLRESTPGPHRLKIPATISPSPILTLLNIHSPSFRDVMKDALRLNALGWHIRDLYLMGAFSLLEEVDQIRQALETILIYHHALLIKELRDDLTAVYSSLRNPYWPLRGESEAVISPLE